MKTSRPLRATAVGWACVLAGTAQVVGFAMYLRWHWDEVSPLFADKSALPLKPTWFGWVASLVTAHLGMVAALSVIISAFGVVAGVSFLRGHRWGRLGLEAVCWFGVVGGLFTMAFLAAIRSMLLGYHLAETDKLALSLPRTWTCLAWLGANIVLLILMKGQAVQTWLKCTEPNSHEG